MYFWIDIRKFRSWNVFASRPKICINMVQTCAYLFPFYAHPRCCDAIVLKWVVNVFYQIMVLPFRDPLLFGFFGILEISILSQIISIGLNLSYLLLITFNTHQTYPPCLFEFILKQTLAQKWIKIWPEIIQANVISILSFW